MVASHTDSHHHSPENDGPQDRKTGSRAADGLSGCPIQDVDELQTIHFFAG